MLACEAEADFSVPDYFRPARYLSPCQGGVGGLRNGCHTLRLFENKDTRAAHFDGDVYWLLFAKE